VSKAKDNANLTEVKLALAAKCERLMKTAKSEPKRQTMAWQAARFRRQAADLTRK
jgi:hypothetical protein